MLILFVSHHAPEQHDHCLLVPLGSGRRLPVCARCVGIYPVAFLLLFLEITGRIELGWLYPIGIVLLPLPAVTEFLLEQTGKIRGSNLARIATGIPLGIALSPMFMRYFRHPMDPFFWGVVAVYGGVCGLTAAFIFRKRFSEKTGL